MKGPPAANPKNVPVMAKKGRPKKPQEHLTRESPINPYEMMRLKKCMSNSARLKELGLPPYNPVHANKAANRIDKSQRNHRESEGSGSDYDPSQDATDEGDLIDEDNAKGTKEKTFKKIDKQTSSMQPSGVKFQSRKRVFADQAPCRVTRSKKSTAHPDASLQPSDIDVPPPMANVSPAGERGANFDDHTPAVVEDERNTGMTTGVDFIPQNDQQNHVDNREGFAQNDDSTLVADVGGGHNQMANEGRRVGRDRGATMGHGLQRLNRARRGKLSVVITEGNIRPVAPLVAAKYATECNIAVRNHIPVFKHWKEYKKQPGLFTLFLGKLKSKFHIDTDDETVKKACLAMMKTAVRQERFKLKKEFFDPFPLHLVTKTSPKPCMTNKQWTELVESWKSPRKMEICQKNKDNRGNVKYHHTTGSRAYMVHVENLGDTDDEEPDAFDLFKECHYSKKNKGYTPAVQAAIIQMENMLSTTTEGEEPKSATEVVGAVLSENTKKNQFLQNVGIQKSQP